VYGLIAGLEQVEQAQLISRSLGLEAFIESSSGACSYSRSPFKSGAIPDPNQTTANLADQIHLMNTSIFSIHW